VCFSYVLIQKSLIDSQLVSTTTPNTHPEVTSKDFLEQSSISKCSIGSWFSGNNFEFSKEPECSFSGKLFRYDHV